MRVIVVVSVVIALALFEPWTLRIDEPSTTPPRAARHSRSN
jgi:hypothetical protein